MLNKTPIIGVVITTMLTLSYSAVARADVFIASNGGEKNIVITGLTAGSEYSYNFTDKKGKSKTKEKKAKKCGSSGQIIIDDAEKYTSFSFNGTSLDFSNVQAMPTCARTLATYDAP